MNPGDESHDIVEVDIGELRVGDIDAGVLVIGVVLERVKSGTAGGFVGEGLA